MPKAALRGVSLLRGPRACRHDALRPTFARRAAKAAKLSAIFSTTNRSASSRARSVVAPGAQKTDGKMLCKALLLTDMVRDEHQAGARNLRRRCRLRPWHDLRRPQRGSALLSADARPALCRRPRRCCSKPSAASSSTRSRDEGSSPLSAPRLPLGSPSARCGRHMNKHIVRCAARCDAHARGFPDPFAGRSMASRSSISTMPPRRRSRGRSSIAWSHATYHEYANVHRGLHYLANAATDAFEAARESVRAFLNAESVERDRLHANRRRESINLVASSFGQAFIKEGDEIVLSIMEHHANIVPWHFLRERKGAVLKWVDVDDDGNFRLDAIREGADRRRPRSSPSPICRTCSAR